jgi:hypothetical protein
MSQPTHNWSNDMSNIFDGITASLENIQWHVGDVIAPAGKPEAKLTLTARAKNGWHVRQQNGRHARYSIQELLAGKYDKVQP